MLDQRASPLFCYRSIVTLWISHPSKNELPVNCHLEKLAIAPNDSSNNFIAFPSQRIRTDHLCRIPITGGLQGQ